MSDRQRSISLLTLAAVLALGAGSAATAQSSSSSAPPQDNKPAAAQPASQAGSQAGAQPAAQTDAASQPQPQSLADAARANAQKDKPKAKKVYTVDDLSSLHGTISVVGDKSGGSDDRDDADGSGSSGAAGSNSEQYWRSRAQAIKQEIADTDRQIDDVKAEIAKQGAASFDPSTGLSQGVIIVHDRNAEVKQLEDRKASLEHQLDDLADEARKAGADPGWAR
jgi:hypothetical protein